MGWPAAQVAHSVNLRGRLTNVNPRPFIVLVVVNAGRHIMQRWDFDVSSPVRGFTQIHF